jgi:hypothetical protein
MSSINSLLDKIIALEKAIKKKYPKQAGRVRIANAKQATDYSFNDPDPNMMEWNSRYHTELENAL